MELEAINLHIDNYPPEAEEGEIRTVALGLGRAVFLMDLGVDDSGEASINIAMSGLVENEEVPSLLEEVSTTISYIVAQLKENTQ